MHEGKGRAAFGSRARLRSYAIGMVGAVGAIAAVRQMRRSSAALRASGLSAFEDAPCFLESHGHADVERAAREVE